MSLFSSIKQKAKQAGRRGPPKVLTVKNAWRLTPNMIRVTFHGPELAGFPKGRERGNCKLMIPDEGDSSEVFTEKLNSGVRLVKRTYTVRHFEAETQTLTIDFVAHGDNGPASRWAISASAGSFLGFAGPSTPKVAHFEADWYLIAADSSALPVAAAALEAMPRDAIGVAIFEVPSLDDKQKIDMPDGIEAHWLVHEHAHHPSTKQLALIESLHWPTARIQTCIAGESGVVRSIKAFLRDKPGLSREDHYCSGYWRIGLVEDEHQLEKRDRKKRSIG